MSLIFISIHKITTQFPYHFFNNTLHQELFKLLSIQLKPKKIKPVQFFQNAIDKELHAFDPELPISTQLTGIAILELVDKEIVEKYYATE